MKKILVIIPLILALYTAAETAVDSAFEAEAITINTEFLNKLPSKTEPAKTEPAKTIKASIVRAEASFSDVSNLVFTNPKIDIETNVEKVEKIRNKRVSKPKVVKKSVKSFNLDIKEINVVKKVTKARKITNNIIELDINEKVEVYAYTKTKKIKKTNWSAIFEYSPEKSKAIEEVEPQKVNASVLAKTKARKIKEEKVDNIKKEADRISTKLAATEKSSVLESISKISNFSNNRELKVNTDDGAKQEELVFFDYAAAGNDLNTQKVAKTKIEKPKHSVIVAPKSVEKPKLDFNNIGGVKKSGGPIEPQAQKVDTHSPKSVKIAESFVNSQASAIQVKKPSVNKKNYKSEFSVHPYSADGSGKMTDLDHFEIRFKDDIDDIIQSYGDGEIVINSLINTNLTVRRGTIYSASHYPTTVDFVLEGNEVVAKIPMLEKEYFNSVVQSEQATGLGGQLLVELDKQTEDVDIDKNYERKLFLDKDLKVVDQADSDYSFIMFLGVVPGNAVISFRTVSNQIISKIIHLSDEEIYYEPNFYIEVENESFELNEEYLLSKDQGPLSIDPKEILGLTHDHSFVKMTNNTYALKSMKYPLGSRSYFELKHLRESIYVGRWKSESVTVPSEQYMRYVLDKFNANGMRGNCLVQINLSKKAKDLKYNGHSQRGFMRTQVRILDQDGVFYRDLSYESEKIFLMGEGQGIINVKILYVDGSSDYLQSYCSDNTYLVEQL